MRWVTREYVRTEQARRPSLREDVALILRGYWACQRGGVVDDQVSAE
jgi:hypothetical protein